MSMTHNDAECNAYGTLPALKTYSGSIYHDERPITPLRDRMVYDVKCSSLDFRDGLFIAFYSLYII